MEVFLGLLVFVLFIALIIGLVRPASIMRWSKNPTRLKVFGYWLLATFIVGTLGVLTENDEDKAKLGIDTAKDYIKEENYSKAISQLEDIDKESPLYSKAQQLLTKADSLKEITEKEKQLAKEKEAKKAAEEEKLKQKDQLENEIKSIKEGVDFTTYRGSVDALQMELVLFGTWADIIKEGQKSNDKEIQSLAKKLRAKVENIQAREFPRLRKEYADIASKKMWENDIEVYANGARSKYINFTGGLFAANKNKKDFQEQVHEVLKMFRFNQSRYRWFDGADEYTYWTIYEGEDTDLVSFEK